MADEKAWEAALQLESTINCLIPEVPSPPEKQIFSDKEKDCFKELGATESEGKWMLPDGREMLNKAIMRQILTVLHQGSHWGVQAMCDAVNRINS